MNAKPATTSEARPWRVGVMVPCRNESEVIARRIANLARLTWPASSPEQDGQHRVLVIDDHSQDDTSARAQAALRALPKGVRGQLVPNQVRPGKNGAIESGLLELGDSVDLVVLTDADVLVDPMALGATLEAFEQDEQLGMACASQFFIEALDADGDMGEGGTSQFDARSEAWDRVTARVRRIESHFGKLFSVHGQWLAWRADLKLAPRQGVAADDIDLMLQVRGSHRPKVSIVQGARFYECKPPGGEAADAQALRRARAWFQVFREDATPPGLTALDRLQWWTYSRLPAWLPWISLLLAILLVGALAWGLGALAGWALLAVFVGLAFTPWGREWRRTFGFILRAKRLEGREAMPEAWEMRREP